MASSGIPADRIKMIEERMKNQLEKTFILTFNKSASIYKEEDKLEIELSDTGIGISPENIEKLFKSYSMISANNELRGKGTGLGLFLVKQILKSHRANIRAEANMPKGTTFYITFK